MEKEEFMELALKLTVKGRGRTLPNPMVGCVIAKNGKIVGKGFHGKFGGRHAEINALRKAGKKAKGAEMFLTLEPCCHFGKQPPCVGAIIEAGIRKVFVAVKDENELVNGKGIRKLKKEGIEVEIGLMGKEAKKLNEIYFYYIRKNLPFVLSSVAMTFDGKIADEEGKSRWISSKKSREFAHKLRSEYQAIMVGVGTVLKDNPRLTARIKRGINPVRIIIDSRLRIPLKAKVLNESGETIIVCTKKAKREKIRMLLRKKAKVLIVESRKGKVWLKQALRELAKAGIAGIIMEGGSKLNRAALDEKIINKMNIYIAPRFMGKGIDAFYGMKLIDLEKDLKLKEIEMRMIDRDLFVSGYLK